MAKRIRQDSIASLAAPSKYASVSPPPAPSTNTSMRCHLPPHAPLTFSNVSAYETHYLQAHSNRCTSCHHNFPTTHLLDLHIAENHDTIVAAQREAGEKKFACFVEGCEKVCRDWKKRRSHLVDKHAFPKNYDFLVVDHGIDGRRSMLRPGVDADGHRRSSRERGRSGSEGAEDVVETRESQDGNGLDGDWAQDDTRNGAESQSVEETKAEITHESTGIDELTSSMSSLHMVPRSVTFGRRKGRSGFSKS